jgi:hypothetical protein
MLGGQNNPYPIAPHRKGKGASLKPQSEQTHLRHCDDGCLVRARSRQGARNPLSALSGDIDRPRRCIGAASRPLAMSVRDYTPRRSEAEPR